MFHQVNSLVKYVWLLDHYCIAMRTAYFVVERHRLVHGVAVSDVVQIRRILA